MAKKNSSDFQIEKANGELLITTSAAQKTTNFQPIDNYNVGAIFSATASVTVANTVTETSIVGTGVGSVTLPANFLAAGKTLRFKMFGTIGSVLTPTARIKIKIGSVVVIDTTALALLVITGTNIFETEAMITCRTAGASGTVFGQGLVFYYTSSTGLSGIATPNTTTSTIDTTASQTLDVTFTWGTASASNTITCTNTLIKVTI